MFPRDKVEQTALTWDDVQLIARVLDRLKSMRREEVALGGDESEAFVGWMIDALGQAHLHRCIALAEGCIENWNRGAALPALLCARALLETAAFLFDLQRQLTIKRDDGGYSEMGALAMARTFATRDKARVNEKPAFLAKSVLSSIQSISAVEPLAVELYELLSEVCHPNHLGHAIFGAYNSTSRRVEFNGEHADVYFQGVLHALQMLVHVETALVALGALAEDARHLKANKTQG